MKTMTTHMTSRPEGLRPRGLATALRLAAAAGLAVALAAPVHAQAQMGRPAVSAHYGAFHYDLAGTGSASHLAARVELPFSRMMVGQASLGHARVGEPGDRVTLLTPEVQAHLRWPVGRVAPFVGLGAGALIALEGEGQSERETLMSFSVAGGLRGRLTERLGAVGELRVRGADPADRGFAHSVAEWTAGLSWQL
jgi:hypothetical protein